MLLFLIKYVLKNKQKNKALGKHVLVEFTGCSIDVLEDATRVEQLMRAAAEEANATIINSIVIDSKRENSNFHLFSPYGISGVVVIQESHLAIHTWPEYGYAAVDIFTCGADVDPMRAYDYLKKGFEAQKGHYKEIGRGIPKHLQKIDLSRLVEDRSKKEVNSENLLTMPTLATNSTKEEEVAKNKTNSWFTDKDDSIALSLRHTGELLYSETSPYQRVRVIESYAYGKMLLIDDMVMTTEKDEFVYHEMIAHVPTFIHGTPKRILVIGGGDGGTIRELFKHTCVEHITMVEIDEKVVEASRLYLPELSCEFDNPKLDLHIQDGIVFLQECEAEQYDMIVVDGSDPKGPAEGLFSPAFYKNVYRALKPNGVLNVQSEGPLFSQDAFVGLNYCLKDIFGKDSVACYLAYISTYPTGMWSFTTAIKGQALTPLRFDVAAATIFSEQEQLKYYTPQMHYAAYTLPPFVQDMLE
ncbi:MAG: polyamine aminopropyltransferase [Aureispira sp.]